MRPELVVEVAPRARDLAARGPGRAASSLGARVGPAHDVRGLGQHAVAASRAPARSARARPARRATQWIDLQVRAPRGTGSPARWSARSACLAVRSADGDRDRARRLTPSRAGSVRRRGMPACAYPRSSSPSTPTGPRCAALGGGRGARRRLPVQLGPLLPAPGRPGRQALRGADRARGDGRGDRARRARLAGDLQRLPQPRVPRRRPPHDRPHLRRARDPRDRRRLVRARLRRVRLRVRDRRQPPDRAGGGAAADRVAAGQAQAAAAARPHADPDRRRRGQAHAQARRPPRRHLARVRRPRRLPREERDPRRALRRRGPRPGRDRALVERRPTGEWDAFHEPASRTSSSASAAAARATTSGRCASSCNGGTPSDRDRREHRLRRAGGRPTCATTSRSG